MPQVLAAGFPVQDSVAAEWAEPALFELC
jgi:hypothetical protein